MLRYVLAALAVLVLLTVSLIPDEAFARRGGGGGGRGGFHGGGMRAGGFHGGGMRAAHIRGGGVYAGRGYRYAGRPRPVHPIAGRPIAGRPGYPGRPIAGYPGYRPGYGWRGAAYGAAVGAAAVGTYGYYNNYYNNQCFYDTYGNYVCPQQYPYRYY